MVIKIVISLFVAFALSRAIIRYREKSFGMFALIFWTLIWCVIAFFVWKPASSDAIARILGVGRGVEALLAVAVVILFYGVFRLYVKLEFIEHELTVLVRRLASGSERGKK